LVRNVAGDMLAVANATWYPRFTKVYRK